MSTQQEQTATDPYAELKQAWEAGRRIRLNGMNDAIWCQKGVHGSFSWTHPPEYYEIEPMPTDKWAAEKAAYAQGKKIECRYKSVLDKPWETNLAPSWVDEFEYRIAPDPTPAGKMSDKELAEIYQNTTAASHVGHSVYKWDELSQDHQEARIQGIRAVREQVEKEQAAEVRPQAQAMFEALLEKKLAWLSGCEKGDAEMSKESSDAEIANYLREIRLHVPPACHWILNSAALRLGESITKEAKQADEIARLTAEFSELEAKYADMCTRLQECVQKFDLGLGGEKIDKLVVEAVASLTAQLAAVTAERDRLQWRPVSVKPTREDADSGNFVTVLCENGRVERVPIGANGFNPDFDWSNTHKGGRYTMWRPACLPSAEEVERERFEKWAKHHGHDCRVGNEPDRYASIQTDSAWSAWQARATAD